MNNITAAGIGPLTLVRMGATNAAVLKDMGFDALHVADTKFATEAVAAYGARAVVETFLVGPSDAVAIAGSDSMDILGVRSQELMEACAGAPVEARAVLQQLPVPDGLLGVSATTLLDTGLRKTALLSVGYSLVSVVEQTGASGEALLKLGFSL